MQVLWGLNGGSNRREQERSAGDLGKGTVRGDQDGDTFLRNGEDEGEGVQLGKLGI